MGGVCFHDGDFCSGWCFMCLHLEEDSFAETTYLNCDFSLAKQHK